MADIVFYNFLGEIGNKEIDFEGDTLKCALIADGYTPNVDHTQYSDVSGNEVANGNGYTTGGVTVAGTITKDAANNLAKYDVVDPSWTASAGAIGPARYGVVYDDTTATKYLIYLIDFGGNETANDGADFKITIDADGLFSIAQA